MRDREINEKGKIGQLQRGRESLRRKGGLRRCGEMVQVERKRKKRWKS